MARKIKRIWTKSKIEVEEYPMYAYKLNGRLEVVVGVDNEERVKQIQEAILLEAVSDKYIVTFKEI